MAPRLPTAEDLGQAGSLASQRGIASYDLSPLARGDQAIGQGIEKIGNAGLGVGLDMIQKERRQAETLEEAQARADLLTSQAKRKSAITDATDAADLEKVHREGGQADLDAAAQRISDPARRALFLEQGRPAVEGLGIAAKDKAFGLTSDAKKAEVLNQLEALKQTAVSDQDPLKKTGYIDAGNALISSMEKEGYITAEQAEQRRQSWGKSYAVEAVQAMNPAARLAAVRGGWEGALINRESSGNPRVVNQFGYAGLYQMGAPLLSTLGLYKPGADENLGTWSGTAKDAPGKWTGTFNIPGYPGVRTLADFRENPEAQRAAFLQSQTYYDGQIVQRGLDKYIGQEVGGVPITREGIYSMMHLGGAQGAETALKGGRNRADANGSTVLGYAKMAADAGAADGQSVAKFLSPEQRVAIANGATRDLITQDRAAQNAQANEASTVRALMKDDEASIMTQGAPVAALTPERVQASLGPAVAETFAQNRAQAVRYHDATNDWDQIPVEEIRARLGTLQPAPGSPGYSSQSRYAEAAQKRADAIVKERRTDPAAAADRLPDVRAALDGASLDRPETYQAVAKARAVAQDRLRIPEDQRVPMTRAEAQQVARPLELAAQGGDEKETRAILTDTVKQLQTAFGDDADLALQQVIKEAHMGRLAAGQAVVVLKKLARAEQPSQAEMRAVDEAVKTSAAERAVAAVAPQPAARNDALDQAGMDYQVAGGTNQPAAPTFPTPDNGAIDLLKKTPALARQFDKTYGPGASERVLAITGRQP